MSSRTSLISAKCGLISHNCFINDSFILFFNDL